MVSLLQIQSFLYLISGQPFILVLIRTSLICLRLCSKLKKAKNLHAKDWWSSCTIKHHHRSFGLCHTHPCNSFGLRINMLLVISDGFQSTGNILLQHRWQGFCSGVADDRPARLPVIWLSTNAGRSYLDSRQPILQSTPISSLRTLRCWNHNPG